jgi:hypothetical protein
VQHACIYLNPKKSSSHLHEDKNIFSRIRPIASSKKSFGEKEREREIFFSERKYNFPSAIAVERKRVDGEEEQERREISGFFL